nr:GLPGLI family protein [uncultured Sediminibacterium sp.]
MYKKFLSFLIILFLFNNAISQDKISLMLEFKMVHVVDTTQPSNPRIIPCMLLAGSKMSVYDDYYRTLRYLGYSGIAVDRVYNDPFEIQDAMNGISSDQIFIDFEKQELITGTYLSNNLYAIKELLPQLKWTIFPQKKQILQYECQMATTTFKGRNYTSWFAPAIPINAGPWKLNGLPGIILAANDDRNEISFTCTKITLPEKNQKSIAFSKKAIQVNADKLKKVKKALTDDSKAAIGMSSDPRGTIMAITVSPSAADAMQTKVKTKPRPLNNPIEKE